MDRLELRVGSLGGVDMRICTAPRDGLVSDKLYWAAGKRIGRTNPNQKTYHVNYIPKQVRWQRLGTCMSILSYSTCCWKMSQRSTNTNRRFGARRSCQIQRCNQYRLLPWLQRATVYSGENQTTQFKSACNSAPETALRFPHGGGGGWRSLCQPLGWSDIIAQFTIQLKRVSYHVIGLRVILIGAWKG